MGACSLACLLHLGGAALETAPHTLCTHPHPLPPPPPSAPTHTLCTHPHPRQVASSLQSMIICFEMLIASIMHIFFFPWDEFNNLPDRDTHLEVPPSAPMGGAPDAVRAPCGRRANSWPNTGSEPLTGAEVETTPGSALGQHSYV